MAKAKSVFFCTECGNETPKWAGRCPSCGAWNTLVEQAVGDGAKAKAGGRSRALRAKAHPIAELDTAQEIRFPTGMGELDRVLGGGAVQGSLVLVGGAPGIGKSTLMLQICGKLSETAKILYVSGEESPRQLKLRADRLGVQSDNLYVLSETCLGDVLESVEEEKPDVLIVDSIQTLYQDSLESPAGSVAQVRACTLELMQLAKGEGITVFVIGHVNKEGSIAGPKVFEIGVFEMRSEGLVEVPNPSEMLLSGRPDDAPGTCVTCVMEGQRPVLAEVQALLAPAAQSVSRRTSNGFDYNRAAMLMAVLEKRGALKVSGCDAFLNVIGGLSVDEPAADLAAVLALASSYLDKPIGNHVAAIGEVGLTGELRSVNHLSERLSEVHRLGFETCIIPKQRKDQIRAPQGLALIEACNIAEALRAIVQA